MSDAKSNHRGPGRPRLDVQRMKISFRLREGRSPAEDALMERLDQLPPRHRSRFIRRVLTTGDLDPILDRELAIETERVGSALDALATYYDDDDEEDEFS